MVKKGRKGGHKGRKLKIWWFTLVGAIASWVLVLVFFIMMYQAMVSFQVDLGDDPNIFGAIFGSIFGILGGMVGIAAVYSEWMTIFFWIAIVLTVSTIVLVILERKKKK
jgi:hypothetical protein